MSTIKIIKINAENWREALALSVHDEQQKYVASVTPPVAIALAKAYIKPDGKVVEPYGIYNQNQIVGFFNLHYTPKSKDDYWLFHFFIDKKFQRNGFGSKALTEIIKHIKHTNPSFQRLRLTVHPENDAGKSFYTKFGFTDDHVLTFDEPTFSYLRIEQD
ncbi:MAG: GNAT family N-acetyltransferase [Bacillaceae bacterium]